jgi:uncharacterized membrane protein
VIFGILASANPFDWRTALLARHAQHVVLIHFPIALYLTGAALDLSALWFNRKNLEEAAYWNLTLAAFAALPAVVTGLIAWQWQLEGQSLKGILLEHMIAGGTAALAICWPWILHHRTRRAGRHLPPARFLLEAAGTLAVVTAGHLGGFLSGVAQ